MINELRADRVTQRTGGESHPLHAAGPRLLHYSASNGTPCAVLLPRLPLLCQVSVDLQASTFIRYNDCIAFQTK